MKVQMLTAAAIPVGHRVAVRWFVRKTKTKSIFDAPSEETHDDQPLVEDLDTGVVYTCAWLHDVLVDRYGSMQLPDGFGKGIEETRAVVGRVRACRIVTGVIVNGDLAGASRTETELTITPDEEGAPYR